MLRSAFGPPDGLVIVVEKIVEQFLKDGEAKSSASFRHPLSAFANRTNSNEMIAVVSNFAYAYPEIVRRSATEPLQEEDEYGINIPEILQQ